MPTLEIDIALVTLCAAILFGGGWEGHAWYAGSKHATELQAQINATNTAQKAAYDIALQFESASRAARDSQAQLLEKWSTDNAKPHPVCLLSDASIVLLRTATAENAPAP